MTASQFTTLFLVLLALNFALKFWLDARQIRHVRANRDRVPPQFDGSIGLAAHQKAADYTIARTRVGVADEVIGIVVVLALTLGGGLAWLYSVASGMTSQPLLRDL